MSLSQQLNLKICQFGFARETDNMIEEDTRTSSNPSLHDCGRIAPSSPDDVLERCGVLLQELSVGLLRHVSEMFYAESKAYRSDPQELMPRD